MTAAGDWTATHRRKKMDLSHPPQCLSNQLLWLQSVEKHLRDSEKAEEKLGICQTRKDVP